MTIKVNIFKNIKYNIIQFLVSIVIYFFLYKYLLMQVGIEKLGVWSIILAISSTTSVANLGIGLSVVKFTARFREAGDEKSINQLIYIALIIIIVLYTIVAVLINELAALWLKWVIDEEYIELSKAILHLTILSIWINSISNNVFMSCIDGYQKNYIRSILNILGSIVLLIISLYMVPKYGLIGAAYAQIIQSIIVLIISIILLKKIHKSLNLIKINWNYNIFKKLVTIGRTELIVTIFLLSLDPITKSCLAKYGSLNLTAYYELANKIVLQIRGLIVGINQLMLPIYSKNKNDIINVNLYEKNFSINYLVSLSVMTLLMTTSIIISNVIYKATVNDFIFCMIALTIANFFNIISTPSYFLNLANGELKNNLNGTLLIGVFNAALSYIMGVNYAGKGVILGTCLALVIGSTFIVYKLQKIKNIKIVTMNGDRNTNLNTILAVAHITLFAIIFSIEIEEITLFMKITIIIIMNLILVIIPFFLHPKIKINVLMITKYVNKQN
jgi:O-antigen/teichoic acid export membrane protein